MYVLCLQGVAQSAALQCTLLEDCLNSGKAYARLSCDGQAPMPAFSSEVADALAQVSQKAVLSCSEVCTLPYVAAAERANAEDSAPYVRAGQKN